MYLQVTTRCNFLCKHCFGAYTRKGTDISLETVEAAITCGIDGLQSPEITIGGGEPCLHPHLPEIVRLVQQVRRNRDIYLITNGSQLELLEWLLDTGIQVYISDDEWHRPFWSVRQTQYMNEHPEIPRRTVPLKEIVPHGRAKNWSPNKHRTDCTCGETHVHPDGHVTICSCPNAPILGNVKDKIEFPVLKESFSLYWGSYFCWGDYLAYRADKENN